MASQIDSVLAGIDKKELTELALALGNIDSPTGQEKGVADFVESWLKQQDFRTKIYSLLEDRPNVVGVYKGTGGGYSLIYNSHMDTVVAKEDTLTRRDPNEAIFHTAWQEGNNIHGIGVVNDKGPMACFMIAAKAIKKAGVKLKGDLILTTVSGEISREPVDEYKAPEYPGKIVGTRWLVTHGVMADYALVAEATGFESAWVEAGKALIKITIFGHRTMYTPYYNPPYTIQKHPNAIIRMAKLIETIDQWAVEYQKKHTYVCPGGTIIPGVVVGAVRGGMPFHPTGTSELCSTYLDVRTAPGQDMLAIKAELENMIKSLGLEGEVELYYTVNGYEAKNIDRLSQAVERAHGRIFNDKPKICVGPICSMWRDMNVFNEVGIPSMTYGPAVGAGGGIFSVDVDDLYKATQAYAMITLDICSQEKKA